MDCGPHWYQTTNTNLHTSTPTPSHPPHHPREKFLWQSYFTINKCMNQSVNKNKWTMENQNMKCWKFSNPAHSPRWYINRAALNLFCKQISVSAKFTDIHSWLFWCATEMAKLNKNCCLYMHINFYNLMRVGLSWYTCICRQAKQLIHVLSIILLCFL